MIGKSGRSKLFIAMGLIAPFLFGFFVPVMGRSSFWVNDDLGNLLWLSGGFSGTPEFLNPVLGPEVGLLVSTLYRITSKVPWYPLALVAFPASAFALLNLRILRGSGSRAAQLAIGTIGGSALTLLGARPNYTLSAFLTSTAAVSMILLTLSKSNWKSRELALPSIICVFGMSLRTAWPINSISLPQPFLFSSLVGILAFVIIATKLWSRELAALATALAIPYFSSLVLQRVLMHTSSDWTQFVEFHGARGAVSSVAAVNKYLGETPPSIVEAETGLNELEMFLLDDWILFDAESPTIQTLRRLREASNHQSQDIADTVVSALEAGVTHVANRQGVLLFLALVFLIVSRVSLLSRVRRGMLKSVPFLFVPLLIIGYVKSTERMPDYVAVATSYCLLVLGTLIALTSNRQTLFLSHTCRLVRPTALVLATISGLALSAPHVVSAIDHYPELLPLTQDKRRAYYRDLQAQRPLLTSVSDDGLLSLQSFPFDTQVPIDFLNSMNFSGGSNVRSPQYVRRWNRLTGESETTHSLFNRQFWQRVLIPDHQAVSLATRYWLHRNECLAVTSSELNGYSNLTKADGCSQMVAIGNLHKDDSMVWYSTGTLSLYAEKSISRFELLLLSPFGEYAQLHEVAIVRLTRDNQIVANERTVIPPREGIRVLFKDLQPLDQILIESQSSCVIPFELDPTRFPDQRVFCFGIAQPKIDGRSIPLTELVPPVR